MLGIEKEYEKEMVIKSTMNSKKNESIGLDNWSLEAKIGKQKLRHLK